MFRVSISLAVAFAVAIEDGIQLMQSTVSVDGAVDNTMDDIKQQLKDEIKAELKAEFAQVHADNLAELERRKESAKQSVDAKGNMKLTPVVGVRNTNVCPEGAEKIVSEEDCQIASDQLGHTYLVTGTGKKKVRPGGCYVNKKGKAYFNDNVAGGAAFKQASPLCMEPTTTTTTLGGPGAGCRVGQGGWGVPHLADQSEMECLGWGDSHDCRYFNKYDDCLHRITIYPKLSAKCCPGICTTTTTTTRAPETLKAENVCLGWGGSYDCDYFVPNYDCAGVTAIWPDKVDCCPQLCVITTTTTTTTTLRAWEGGDTCEGTCAQSETESACIGFGDGLFYCCANTAKWCQKGWWQEASHKHLPDCCPSTCKRP